MTILVILAVTSLVAATVNGSLGYGYSAISVPISLLVVASRVLNPALVMVEVVINLYSLWWNRGSLRNVYRRVIPLVVGLIPGVVVGSLLVNVTAPATVKLVVYGVLLPLIVVQASGKRWPIKAERGAAVPLGGAVGVLYGLTTISGPPLALFWNNQGLAKNDFKVGLAIVRSVESIAALITYSWLGMITSESTSLLPWIAPGVLIGFPIGHWLIRHVGVETFRRVCMSFDAYLVAFGLARTLIDAGVQPLFAYQVLAVTSILDSILLWGFFRDPAHAHAHAGAAPSVDTDTDAGVAA